MHLTPEKQFTAWTPIAMSLVALAMVFGHVALFGSARQPDEGTAAHVWQLLMAAQVPIIVWFAVEWLPKTPQRARIILVLQAVAALAALAPVFLLGL